MHIPELLVNTHNIARFGKLVIGWSRLSMETSVLEVIRTDQHGSLVVGLPHNRELACVELESELARQFKYLDK